MFSGHEAFTPFFFSAYFVISAEHKQNCFCFVCSYYLLSSTVYLAAQNHKKDGILPESFESKWEKSIFHTTARSHVGKGKNNCVFFFPGEVWEFDLPTKTLHMHPGLVHTGWWQCLFLLAVHRAKRPMETCGTQS